MNYKELNNSKDYKLHHRASASGYVSRVKEFQVDEYDGRFGKGYVVHIPRLDTNRYHYIYYYIRRENNE